MSVRASLHPCLPLLLALLALGGLAACGDQGTAPDRESGQHSGDEPEAWSRPTHTMAPEATIHLVELYRLQGRVEGSPCIPGSLEPLAAGAALKQELLDQGDGAALVCFGDTLTPTYLKSQTWPRKFAAETRGAVVLESLAQAGVDVFVPGQADLARQAGRLLDRCRDLGIPVVLSNVTIPGRDDILPYKIIEHDGLRLAILGVTRADGIEDLEGGATVQVHAPRETVAEISRELVRKDLADFVVVLSNVSVAATVSMFNPANVHAVIGTLGVLDGTGMGVTMREGTAYMLVEPGGLEVGLTTLHVVDGDLGDIVNLSPLHSLPTLIALNQADLDVYRQRYGTDDLIAIAQQVMPADPSYFLRQAADIEANREHVRDLLEHQGSFIDHQRAEVPEIPENSLVRARLARIPERLHAAFDASELAPLREIDPITSITGPEDCRSCHEAQYDFWAGTAHAGSYQTLVDRGAELDQDCLECHTTGFGEPGGWEDPREAAPFGPVSCWECHETTWPHANSPGRVVDPLYVHSEAEYMKCADCHYETRLPPGWDRETAMRAVRCPPMSHAETPIEAALHAALGTIQTRRAKNEELERDRYLEGRALMGLEQLDEGTSVLAEVADANDGDVRQAIEIARLLDEHGRSTEALESLRGFLAFHKGEPLVNEEYLRLLLEARDASAQDPAAALRQLRFILPLDPAKLSEVPVNVRLYEIDALMRQERQAEATAKLIDMAENYMGDARVGERMERYLGVTLPRR